MTAILFPPIPMSSWTAPALVGSARTAGRSSSGIIAMSRHDGGGLWQVQFTTRRRIHPDHGRLLHALKAMLADGARPVSVPFALDYTQPWPTVDGELLTSYGSIPHSDGSLFSDGSGYFQPVIDVTLAASADLRATELELELAMCGELRGGELFSIDHTDLGDRWYVIKTIEEQDGESAAVTIEPPLREAAATGTSCNFDMPRCIMQVEGSEGFQVSTDLARVTLATASFVESFLPLS